MRKERLLALPLALVAFLRVRTRSRSLGSLFHSREAHLMLARHCWRHLSTSEPVLIACLLFRPLRFLRVAMRLAGLAHTAPVTHARLHYPRAARRRRLYAPSHYSWGFVLPSLLAM